MPKLALQQQKIDDAIFKCYLCKMRFELEHEHKYEIYGTFSGGNEETKAVHIIICECCAMDLNLIRCEEDDLV